MSRRRGATIRVEAELTPEQLIRAVSQLGADELEEFVKRVMAIRAEQRAPHLDEQESALLQEINRGLPSGLRAEYEGLIARRQARSLTDEEHARLLQLTTEVEALEARRAACLAELARLRHTSLASLLDTLGIPAPGHG